MLARRVKVQRLCGRACRWLSIDSGITMENADVAQIDKSRIGVATLPKELTQAVECVLRDVNMDQLRPDAFKIFDSLRSTTGSVADTTRQVSLVSQLKNRRPISPISSTQSKPQSSPQVIPPTLLQPHLLAYTERICRAYLVARLPTTYASTLRTLHQLNHQLPDLNPRTVLDFGCGPGTSIWALRSVYGDAQFRNMQVLAIDVNSDMIRTAQQLIASISDDSTTTKRLNNITFGDYLPVVNDKKFDLTVTGFTLSEMTDPNIRKTTVLNLWNLTNDVMVLVDRGTPGGFECIIEARDNILHASEGTAQILAPCPHASTCPLRGSTQDWCHFSQRVERPSFTSDIKHSKHSTEDAKFSYLIIQRQSIAENDKTININPSARLVFPPMKRGGHVLMDGCTEKGEFQRFAVTKSMGKSVYKDARKAAWGDLWSGQRIKGVITRPLPFTPVSSLEISSSSVEKTLSRIKILPTVSSHAKRNERVEKKVNVVDEQD